jgi:polar amino acid transport system substrate-binding protein
VETASVNIGLRKEPDPALLNAVNKWLAETHAKGEIKQVILTNMEKLAGVKPNDFPTEVKF